MDKNEKEYLPRIRLVNSRSLFIVSIFVAIVTIVAVWLLGLGQHRTLFINSILSVSILSAAFLFFIINGLFRGIKLKDDIGKITDKYRFRSYSGLWDIFSGPSGCVGDLEGVLAWLMAGIMAIILLYLLGNMFWFLILVFAAMLYWIFFRALRLVFKKTVLCKGNFLKSTLYGLYYTILYNFWIYGIIIGLHYLIH